MEAAGSENTKYTYFKNTIKYSIIHNTQDPDFVFFVSLYIYIYTRFLSYIYMIIIRKIIMNYDEPAKTSVGEVARYGYGRTERPCGRLTSDPWR